jgi:hypothetical protein
MQIQITASQAVALIDVLHKHLDGEPVLLTRQGDGTLVVAFNLATVEIDSTGTCEES